MTMLRQPFVRAVSAFFYRGHSPNYDAYKLRPGLWIHPNDRNSYPAKLAKKKWTFKEFVGLDEYTNILTKMFGDSESCPQVRQCRRLGRGQTCDMVTGCHGYHNASAYLTEAHADRAVDALAAHSFFGLLEAYNASILLAARQMDLTDLVDDDFAQSRASASLQMACSPSKVIRNDPDACRFTFDRYRLDNIVYERAHRVFCGRLATNGLLDDPAIRAELDRNRLCGDVRFDDVEAVCGPLETERAAANLLKLRSSCSSPNKAWWIKNYGFFWEPPEGPAKEPDEDRRVTSGAIQRHSDLLQAAAPGFF